MYFVEKGYFLKLYIIVGVIVLILGYVFLFFLRFKGGKVIVIIFGVWSVIICFRVFFFYVVVFVLFFLIVKKLKYGGFILIEEDVFMVVFGFIIVGVYFYLNNFLVYFLILWFLNLIIMIYKNKEKFVIFYILFIDR